MYKTILGIDLKRICENLLFLALSTEPIFLRVCWLSACMSKIVEERGFHERALRFMKSVKKEARVKVLGRELIVLPGVYPPVFRDSLELVKAVLARVKEGDSVLDFGCASGVVSVFAAEKASSVTAVDSSSAAVECAEKNAELHCFSQKFRAFKSNLFSALKGKKFDLIVFNPPFCTARPKSRIETPVSDFNHSTLKRFLKQARKHLNENGHILLVFSDSAGLGLLKSFAGRNGYSTKKLSQATGKDGFTCFVFELKGK